MKKKNHIKVRFPTILFILAILLCAAPCDGAFLELNYYGGDEYDGDEYYVTEELVNEIRAAKDLGEGGLDSLIVGKDMTVHLYTSVTSSVQAHPGSILNIHSGSFGLYAILSTGEPNPVVTVYGTNFEAKEGGALNPSLTQFTVDNLTGGVLTGTYENGDPIELKFISNIPIYLVQTAVKEVEIDIKPGSYPTA